MGTTAIVYEIRMASFEKGGVNAPWKGNVGSHMPWGSKDASLWKIGHGAVLRERKRSSTRGITQ